MCWTFCTQSTPVAVGLALVSVVFSLFPPDSQHLDRDSHLVLHPCLHGSRSHGAETVSRICTFTAMVAERWSRAPESLSNESEGDGETKMVESAAPDAIDAAEFVAGRIGDEANETWIGAEDAEKHPGEDDVNTAMNEVEGSEDYCRNHGSRRGEMQKTVEVRRVQFLDRVVGGLVV